VKLKIARHVTTDVLQWVKILILPVIGTSFLWFTRANDVSMTQLSIALALLIVPSASYNHWRRTERERIPLFAILSCMYWLYYAVGLFWVEPTIYIRTFALPRALSESAVTYAAAMALLGVCSLWLGIRSRIGRYLVLRARPRLKTSATSLNYIRLVLIGGSILGFSQGATYTFGEGGRQMITILITTVPLLAFVLLLRNLFRGEGTSIDKALIAGFIGLRFLSGMSSGWLGAFVGLMIILGVVYLSERRRLPRTAMLLVVAFTLFFQVGKQDFRKAYWQPGEQSDRIERIGFWINTSLSQWSDALNHPDSETIRSVVNPSLSRVSLLTQTANVIEQTPSEVPYQYGSLYSYMLITFIPRFIWPDKPSVNEANQFYQVAYGLTSEDELEHVSIAVGVLTEAYINFGWIGVAGLMFLGGIFFDTYQRTFLSSEAGVFMNAMGIVLVPQLLAVELQLSQYLGGVFQQIVFTMLVMLPIISLRRARTSLQLASATG
jgi:hypothetical protein